MTKASFSIFCLLPLTVLILAAPVAAQVNKDKPNAERHFALNVLPILKSKCFACHGENPDDLKGKLNLTSRKAMLAGGESGDPSVVVGKPDESILVEAIEWEGYEMPPKENDRLNEKQIKIIRKWIADGAVWPSASRIEQIQQSRLTDQNDKGERIKTSGGLNDEWTLRRYQAVDIWAFRPVKKPPEPKGGYSIDAFIDRKLAQAKVKPAARAEANELVRRATYDLTGLPPKPSDLIAFEKAFAAEPEKAWADLIDRLLASPQYGERWGQHWLDVVRYADTAGFSNDFELSNMWRYRDYVIRSFNNDLPYNRFVVQQIAGDELIAEQKNDRSGKNNDGYHLQPAEGMIATGFLRAGPWEHTAMTPEKLSRQNYLDDVTNNLGQAFLSTALRCSKCHDHKFDPIPTRDYYRIYAALTKAQPAEMPADFLPEENKNQFSVQKKHVEKLLNFAKQKRQLLVNKREAAAKQWYRGKGREDDYVPFEQRIRADAKGEKPPRFIGLTTAEEGRLKVREQDIRIWTRRLERFQPWVQSIYNGRDLLQNSRRMRKPEKKWQRQREMDNSTSYIFAGGNVFSPGEKVTPGVLSCVSISTPTGTDQDPFALPVGESGRRLMLARWIADPDNGLALRSIVNRVWHYHFGRGLAANPNNLGATGAKPTHPELLDWLAFEFVAGGWSIKNLHRTIMNSKAYMRSCAHPNYDNLKNKDPGNKLLAVFQPRRLTAEELRDTMLSASGELNREIGGLPIRPEINLEVALSPRMIQSSISPAYQPERTPQQRNRRSIYAYRIRGLRDPLMEVLDKPNPNESCELRDSASTTPQVFTLLNSDGVIKRSIAMALRLERERDSIESQIDRGYMLVLGRKPTDRIRTHLVSHYQKMVLYHQQHKPKRIEYPTKITRSLVEEFSGESFDYEELLDVYEDYVADKGPADVNPGTRALADICLLLFNSNQMLYVY